MIVTKHIEKKLMRLTKFAKLKNASKMGVWKAISTDRLPVILVGEKKDMYIDPEANKDFVFNENMKRYPKEKTN